MLAIYKRECKAFFKGPLGYIFVAAFMLVMSLMFSMDFEIGLANLPNLFQFMLFACIFLMPLLTMRLVSEEKKMKTDQLLFTAPVSITAVVFGKFLAALTVFLAALGLTLLFPLIVSTYVALPAGVILGNYLMVVLAASVFVAIGLFISSLTENQLIAAILSLVTYFMLLMLQTLAASAPVPAIASLMNFFSVFSRFFALTYGVISLGDIVYYLLMTAIFLFLTVRVFEKKRWA
jgi:ABC-2 type transport system permease protein